MKFRKTLAVLATAVLVGLGISVPVAASAHTGDLKVTAVCNTETGNYDFTATLTTANTGLPGTTAYRVGNANFEGTPNNANGMTGAIPSVGAQTVTLTTFSLPGTTTGKGPWVYAYTKWSDNYGKGSDGQLYDALKGDCEIPIPEEPPALKGSDPVTTSECVTPLDGTALVTTTVTPWVQGHVWNGTEWVLGEKVYGDPTVTTETVPNEDCAPPVEEPNPANPVALIEVICGEANIGFTNPLIGDANQLTASFVVNVDGKFHQAFAIPAGGRDSLKLAFPEDSGSHVVEVFQAGTSEWKSIARGEVTSDCVEPPVVVPPTEEPPVTEPPVVKPPTKTVTTTQKPPVEIAEGDDFLAATGAESQYLIAYSVAAGLLLLSAAGIFIFRAIRNRS